MRVRLDETNLTSPTNDHHHPVPLTTPTTPIPPTTPFNHDRAASRQYPPVPLTTSPPPFRSPTPHRITGPQAVGRGLPAVHLRLHGRPQGRDDHLRQPGRQRRAHLRRPAARLQLRIPLPPDLRGNKAVGRPLYGWLCCVSLSCLLYITSWTLPQTPLYMCRARTPRVPPPKKKKNSRPLLLLPHTPKRCI